MDHSLGHWSKVKITFKSVIWLFLFLKKNMNDYFSFILGMGNIGRQIIINALEAVPSILMLIQLSECWLIADIMSKMSTLYPHTCKIIVFCQKKKYIFKLINLISDYVFPGPGSIRLIMESGFIQDFQVCLGTSCPTYHGLPISVLIINQMVNYLLI